MCRVFSSRVFSRISRSVISLANLFYTQLVKRALIFCVVILFTALLGIIAPAAIPMAPARNSTADRLSSAVGLVFLAVVAINAVMIVFLEGFAWVLPDNPMGYALFGH